MIGKPLIELDRVDSTNSYAARMPAGNGPADGTVVWAHDQFAGRGQQEHVWSSEPGKNLTFTACLRPSFLPADQQFSLNRAVALAVAGTVRFCLSGASPETGSPASPEKVVRIKWPNDIYAGRKKIAGILIEHRVMGDTIDLTLAGIGINLNQVVFPSELPNPVSLAQLLGRELPPEEILQQACRFLEEYYRRLMTGPGSLQREYDSLLLGFGEWRTFRKEETMFDAMIEGTDSYGRLVVRLAGGKREAFMHPEVTLAV